MTDKTNVVSIADARPHLAGPAHCVDCGHNWEAVAPIGMVVLTCPNCGQNKGARMAMVEREGDHWACACGNGLFFVQESGSYCPNCGLDGPPLADDFLIVRP